MLTFATKQIFSFIKQIFFYIFLNIYIQFLFLVSIKTEQCLKNFLCYSFFKKDIKNIKNVYILSKINK